MKRVIFADIGGVCCDNPYRVMAAALKKRFGVPEKRSLSVLTEEAVDLDLGRNDFRRFHANVIASLQIPLSFGDFESMHETSLMLREDVCSLLSDVRRRNGIRIIALSNMPEYTWNIISGRRGMDALFDDAVLSYAYSVAKPDPAFFDIALKRAGVPASDTLFVDDRRDNVRAAGERGIQSILFTSADRLRKEFSMNGLIPYP